MSIKEIFKGIFDKAFATLGDRMKAYEKNDKRKLEPKTPVIIRLDGRAFHTYTRGFDKPFDDTIIAAMQYTTQKLCEEIQNVKIAYSQSDEITLFLSDFDGKNTQQWFNGEVDKIVSLSSSIATYYFNYYMETNHWFKNPEKRKPANFDARAFNVPKHEVVNCFIWRQQDAIRNSISALAQSEYSSKDLHKKSTAQMLEMLLNKKINWTDLSVVKQRGFCVVKEFFMLDVISDNKEQAPQQATRSRWTIDENIPIFSNDKYYIDLLVTISGIESKYDKMIK